MSAAPEEQSELQEAPVEQKQEEDASGAEPVPSGATSHTVGLKDLLEGCWMESL